MNWSHGQGARLRRPRDRRGRFSPRLEPLECRELLAAVSVDAGQPLRSLSSGVLGVNIAWWQSNLSTPQLKQMVQDAGMTSFRFPGGGSADTYHFDTPEPWRRSVTVP